MRVVAVLFVVIFACGIGLAFLAGVPWKTIKRVLIVLGFAAVVGGIIAAISLITGKPWVNLYPSIWTP